MIRKNHQFNRRHPVWILRTSFYPKDAPILHTRMARGRKILLTQTPVLARTGLINQINPMDYEIIRAILSPEHRTNFIKF